MLGLESNLGFEAQHALHSIRRAGVRNWVALMEGVDGTCGLLTTNSSKEVMCVALQQLLSANRIHVAANMLSISLPPKEALDQMLQELRSFMIFVDPPKTLFAKVCSSYYKVQMDCIFGAGNVGMAARRRGSYRSLTNNKRNNNNSIINTNNVQTAADTH